MHHGMCITHVPWCMSGSLAPGGGESIPGACAHAIFRIWQEAHCTNLLDAITDMLDAMSIWTWLCFSRCWKQSLKILKCKIEIFQNDLIDDTILLSMWNAKMLYQTTIFVLNVRRKLKKTILRTIISGSSMSCRYVLFWEKNGTPVYLFQIRMRKGREISQRQIKISILMAQSKTAFTPLLTRWSYYGLALCHVNPPRNAFTCQWIGSYKLK